jgi:hypothetical protein
MQTLCKTKNESWPVNIRIFSKQGEYYEAGIEGRGSYFHVITGIHAGGRFLCIPNWDIGCELSDLTDTYWNAEKIGRRLKAVDKATVICALKYLKET